MNSHEFESRLELARNASRRAGLISVLGVLLLVGAVSAIVWQFNVARNARAAADVAEGKAAELAASAAEEREKNATLNGELAGKLKTAEETINSLTSDLRAALQKAGNNEETVAAAVAVYQTSSVTLAEANVQAARDIKQLNRNWKEIQKTDIAQQIIPKSEQSVLPVAGGKAILQVIVGDEVAKAKVLALRGRLGEGFQYTNVVVARRIPTTTEVRFYHLPEDKREAAEILEKLKAAGLRSGRVSYVIDPDQPRRFFQIAVARDAVP